MSLNISSLVQILQLKSIEGHRCASSGGPENKRGDNVGSWVAVVAATASEFLHVKEPLRALGRGVWSSSHLDVLELVEVEGVECGDWENERKENGEGFCGGHHVV